MGSADPDAGSPLPRISIVIASRNQAGFLRSALDSLAAQDYPDLEVVVVDGASTDGTVELLQQRGDVVTRWVSEPDDGQTHALNKGYDMATGRVFGWLNCDERYQPGALTAVGRAFADDPALEMVFGHRVIVDRQGREIGRRRLPGFHPRRYVLYAAGSLLSDTTFWTARLHRATGRLDEENCRRCAMDTDWFGRLSLRVERWRRLGEYLSEFTQHPGRASLNTPELPQVAGAVVKRLRLLAGVSRVRVLLGTPPYFVLARLSQYGWRGLLRLPSLKVVLWRAGLGP